MAYEYLTPRSTIFISIKSWFYFGGRNRSTY